LRAIAGAGGLAFLALGTISASATPTSSATRRRPVRAAIEVIV
jgi:hypothetical protein